MTDIDNSIITDAKKPRKGSKALIIAAVAAAAAGIVIFAGNYNPPPPTTAVADMPDPPKEIPSGTYYLDGNPENDKLCIVVDGGNIRFQSDDLRAAFAELDLEFDPTLADNPDALESQLDLDMEDWGDSYDYKTFWVAGGEKINVLVRWAVDENGKAYCTGQGFLFYSNTLHTWAGDFILVE